MSVTDADLGVPRSLRKPGEAGFDAGIEMAIAAVLVSPHFSSASSGSGGVPQNAYRVSDLDLASRLSFFLWRSIDDELLTVAAAGTLQERRCWSEVRRMLADARGRQWSPTSRAVAAPGNSTRSRPTCGCFGFRKPPAALPGRDELFFDAFFVKIEACSIC